MSRDVKATIITAAWNSADVLARSLHSALAQTDVSLEVIVADDASTDRTPEVVRSIMAEDPRVRLVQLDRNGGPSAARNAAIEAAKGDWLAVMDSDDLMQPGRLAQMIALGEEVRADCVVDDLQPVDEKGNVLGPSHLAGLMVKDPQHWSLETFLSGCTARPRQAALGYLKPVLRRDFVMQSKLRYDLTLRNGEDFHLVAELLARGGAMWFTPTVGYLYTRRGGSVSARLNPVHARALAAADEAFAERHAETLSPEARKQLQIRRRNLANLTTAEAALMAVKQRRYLDAIYDLVQNPVAITRVFRQLGDGLARRLKMRPQ